MDHRIRRGGIRTPEGFLFELSGGDLALDFANTLDIRPTVDAKDLIPTFADLCSWAQEAGILTREQVSKLVKKGKREPGKAVHTRKQAEELRELMFQIFSRVAEGQDVPDDLLIQWNRFVQRSMRQYKLVRTENGFS